MLLCALLRQIATSSDAGRLSFGTLHGQHPAAPGAGPDDRKAEPKPKKKPNSQRVISSKIAMLSAKVSEVMSWTAKVKESPLFLDCNAMWHHVTPRHVNPWLYKTISCMMTMIIFSDHIMTQHEEIHEYIRLNTNVNKKTQVWNFEGWVHCGVGSPFQFFSESQSGDGDPLCQADWRGWSEERRVKAGPYR